MKVLMENTNIETAVELKDVILLIHLDEAIDRVVSDFDFFTVPSVLDELSLTILVDEPWIMVHELQPLQGDHGNLSRSDETFVEDCPFRYPFNSASSGHVFFEG